MRMTFEQIKVWLEDALTDGWEVYTPDWTRGYNPDFNWYITKEGMTASISIHPNNSYMGVWGADKMAVKYSEVYDWEALVQGLTTCNSCGRVGEVRHLGFADRVCDECHTKLSPKVYYRGWAE